MTTLIEWKPQYSVGVPAVDHEHKELIAQINELFEQSGASVDDTCIEDALGDICVAIGAHFALEENIMRKAGYAEYEAHKNDHEELLEELRHLMDEFSREPALFRGELKKRLGDWFLGHFATFDARLHGTLDV